MAKLIEAVIQIWYWDIKSKKSIIMYEMLVQFYVNC